MPSHPRIRLRLRLLIQLLLPLLHDMRERVVHAALVLERAQLGDRVLEVDGHVARLGGRVVAEADVDLAVAHLVVADDEDEVVLGQLAAADLLLQRVAAAVDVCFFGCARMGLESVCLI